MSILIAVGRRSEPGGADPSVSLRDLQTGLRDFQLADFSTKLHIRVQNDPNSRVTGNTSVIR